MKKLKFKLNKDKIFAHNSRLLNNTETLERVIEFKTESSLIRVLKTLSEILLYLYFLFYFISFNFIFSKNSKSLVSYILNWTLKIVLILVFGFFGKLASTDIIKLFIATKF